MYFLSFLSISFIDIFYTVFTCFYSLFLVFRCIFILFYLFYCKYEFFFVYLLYCMWNFFRNKDINNNKISPEVNRGHLEVTRGHMLTATQRYPIFCMYTQISTRSYIEYVNLIIMIIRGNCKPQKVRNWFTKKC